MGSIPWGGGSALPGQAFPGTRRYTFAGRFHGGTKGASNEVMACAMAPFDMPGARRAGPSPCSVSGPQRYNTLDFAGKVVCQQGCCSPLLDDPEQRGGAPLEAPSAGMEARCCLMRAGGAYGICGCPLHPHMQKNREVWFADHGLSMGYSTKRLAVSGLNHAYFQGAFWRGGKIPVRSSCTGC